MTRLSKIEHFDLHDGTEHRATCSSTSGKALELHEAAISRHLADHENRSSRGGESSSPQAQGTGSEATSAGGTSKEGAGDVLPGLSPASPGVSPSSGIGIGDRVTVNDPRQPRFHEEPGVVVAAVPPIGEPKMFVVQVAGWQPLIPVEKLERMEG